MNSKNIEDKKAILTVSFGTTHPDTRKLCIGGVEDNIAKAFPDWSVRRAFSSRMVIKKVKEKEGIKIDTPLEGLEKMKKEGFSKVIVQPLHILAGEEYEKVCKEVEKFEDGSFHTLAIGKPLLWEKEDYQRAVEALKSQLPEMNSHEKVILMGHGTHHKADESYSILQKTLYTNSINAYIATVEGAVGLKDILPLLKKESIRRVILIPFMLVAGDHAINDMAGEDEDSWKNILEREGYEVNVYLKGLGENKHFQDIFVNHIKTLNIL